MKPNRVGKSVLDSETLNVVTNAAMIYEVDEAFINAGINPDEYEYVRVPALNNTIYVWSGSWNPIAVESNNKVMVTVSSVQPASGVWFKEI